MATSPILNAGAPNAGTDSVQTITVSTPGAPFKITFPLNKRVSANIARDATAEDVQEALIALPGITEGDVECTGGPLDDDDVVCHFMGQLGRKHIPPMTTNSAQVTIANTTPGVDATQRSAPQNSILIDTTTGNIYRNSGTQYAVWENIFAPVVEDLELVVDEEDDSYYRGEIDCEGKAFVARKITSDIDAQSTAEITIANAVAGGELRLTVDLRDATADLWVTFGPETYTYQVFAAGILQTVTFPTDPTDGAYPSHLHMRNIDGRNERLIPLEAPSAGGTGGDFAVSFSSNYTQWKRSMTANTVCDLQGLVDGSRGVIWFTQDPTTARTLSFTATGFTVHVSGTVDATLSSVSKALVEVVGTDVFVTITTFS